MDENFFSLDNALRELCLVLMRLSLKCHKVQWCQELILLILIFFFPSGGGDSLYNSFNSCDT